MSGRRDSPAWKLIEEMSALQTGSNMIRYMQGPLSGFVAKVEEVLARYEKRIAALETEVAALKGDAPRAAEPLCIEAEVTE